MFFPGIHRVRAVDHFFAFCSRRVTMAEITDSQADAITTLFEQAGEQAALDLAESFGAAHVDATKKYIENYGNDDDALALPAEEKAQEEQNLHNAFASLAVVEEEVLQEALAVQLPPAVVSTAASRAVPSLVAATPQAAAATPQAAAGAVLTQTVQSTNPYFS
jgi:hypothetical protein